MPDLKTCDGEKKWYIDMCVPVSDIINYSPLLKGSDLLKFAFLWHSDAVFDMAFRNLRKMNISIQSKYGGVSCSCSIENKILGLKLELYFDNKIVTSRECWW